MLYLILDGSRGMTPVTECAYLNNLMNTALGYPTPDGLTKEYTTGRVDQDPHTDRLLFLVTPEAEVTLQSYSPYFVPITSVSSFLTEYKTLGTVLAGALGL